MLPNTYYAALDITIHMHALRPFSHMAISDSTCSYACLTSTAARPQVHVMQVSFLLVMSVLCVAAELQLVQASKQCSKQSKVYHDSFDLLMSIQLVTCA